MRRIWKNESNPGAISQTQFIHHRHKVTAISTQTVQPDDGDAGRWVSFNLNMGNVVHGSLFRRKSSA
jgi:hypothetical protein